MIDWISTHFDKLVISIGALVWISKAVFTKQMDESGYVTKEDLEKEYMKSSKMYDEFVKKEDWKNNCESSHNRDRADIGEMKDKINKIYDLIFQLVQKK